MTSGNELRHGRVLISEPFIEDPNFKRSVVFLTEHSDEMGSVGFVLNQRTDLAVNMVMEELPGLTTSLFQGGPVELDRLNYLHSFESLDGASEIIPGVYFGGKFESVLEGINSNKYTADKIKFFVGYSGWAPGQLQVEIEDKSWIIADLEAKDILDSDLVDNDLWKKAIKKSGGKNVLLVNSPDAPYLN